MDAVKLATLGTIVTWGSPSQITLPQLRLALSNAGLDPELAKELLPRNAFTRAAREMEEGRIIRKVSEDDEWIKFQFTTEQVHSNEIVYNKEAIVALEKATGIIISTDMAIKDMAQRELEKQLENRSSADVTRLVQKVFSNHKGDLVPLRKGGGVYFVPHTHAWLVEQVWDFLLQIGGRMSRFTVNDGDSATQMSVADSLVDHFQGMLGDLSKEIEGVDIDSPAETIQRRRDQISLLKAKLLSYQYLMAESASDIDKKIKLAEWEYNNKLGIPNTWEPSPEDLPDLDEVMGELEGDSAT